MVSERRNIGHYQAESQRVHNELMPLESGKLSRVEFVIISLRFSLLSPI